MNTCLVFSASFVLTIIVESQGNLRCKSVEGFLVQEQSVSFTEVLGLHTCTLVTQHPIEIQSAISANQLTDSHSFLIVELNGNVYDNGIIPVRCVDCRFVQLCRRDEYIHSHSWLMIC